MPPETRNRMNKTQTINRSRQRQKQNFTTHGQQNAQLPMTQQMRTIDNSRTLDEQLGQAVGSETSKILDQFGPQVSASNRHSIQQ